MTKAIVTGGAGFIGSHLCKRLLEDGKSVLCVDNLYTGSMDNISSLFSYSGFEFLNHDVVEPYVFEYKADEIYNFACPGSPPHYQKDPIFTLKTSIFGILNTLELAKNNNAKLLHASTSEVYGDALVHPQNEKYFGNVNPNGPRACYDEGKRVAETLICDYRAKYNINAKIIRIFNTYGPNMDVYDGRVISNFIVQALQNKDITVYGKGEQTRSFCYVDDLVDGIIKMMKSDAMGPVNLGNPGEFTINQLASLVIEMTGSKSKIINLPLPKDDPTKRRPDISLAKELLDFNPSVKLEQGLQKTIEYFRRKIS